MTSYPALRELAEPDAFRIGNAADGYRYVDKTFRNSKASMTIAELEASEPLFGAATVRTLIEKRDAALAEIDRLKEALDLKPGWSLERNYRNGDEEGDYGWIVFEVRGGVNDREWDEIGFGETPLQALESAHASQALRSTP